MSDTPGGGGGFPPGPPPQQPPQQPPYGQFPAAPPYPYQAAPVARPATVRNATRAWWAATVCWFLGSVLSQALDGHVSSSFQFTTSRSVQNGDGSVLTQTTASPLPLAVSIVAFLIFAGLWALLVYGMYRGANWARIVLAVVGVLGILNLVLQVIAALTAEGLNAGDLLHGLFFLAALGLSIAGYVLMFRADSSPYFTRRR